VFIPQVSCRWRPYENVNMFGDAKIHAAVAVRRRRARAFQHAHPYRPAPCPRPVMSEVVWRKGSVAVRPRVIRQNETPAQRLR